MNKKVKILKSESGQAVFELVVFLPFLVFMFTVLFTVGNSINASINQQKAARRYFFYIYKGNSTVPAADDLSFFAAKGVNKIGVTSVGWREKSEGGGNVSYSTCFPFNTLFGSNKDDTCFEPVTDEGKTNFIRVSTFFGLCGESYNTFGSNKFLPDHFNRGFSGSCTISE